MTGPAGRGRRHRGQAGGLVIVAVLAVVAAATAIVGLGLVTLLGSGDGDDRDDGGGLTSSELAGGDDNTAPAATLTRPSTQTGAEEGSNATLTVVTDTVEEDDATADDSDLSQDQTGGKAGSDTSGTVPTLPEPTSGSCVVTLGDLTGEAGAVDLGSDGACAAVGATIEAVNPRDDLSGVDWGRDIRVCERHPAAADVAIEATTGAGSVTIDGPLSRSADEGADGPIVSLRFTFANRDTPITGPRPLMVCRTSSAELSLVHRPPS